MTTPPSSQAPPPGAGDPAEPHQAHQEGSAAPSAPSATPAPPAPTAAPAPPPLAANTSTVACVRCGRPEALALPRPPRPGPLGREIQAKICRDCWGEWMGTEVMVINELRLNFMDPAAQEVLTRQMREFLRLPNAG